MLAGNIGGAAREPYDTVNGSFKELGKECTHHALD